MRLVRYNESMLDECAELWWGIYGKRPYVVRPDGYEHPNAPSIGPDTFRRQIDEALNGRNISHWQGDVFPDSIMLVEDEGRIAGILVCSVNREEDVGYIRSGFMHRDQRGEEVAHLLVNEALQCFRKLSLRKAEAGPSGSLEVESPLHIAVLEAGFAWEDNWEQVDDEYKVSYNIVPRNLIYMGGSLEGFQLQPEIKEAIETLRKQDIAIEPVSADERQDLTRYDTHEPPMDFDLGEEIKFVALVDGLLVGWFAGGPCRQTPEVIARCDAPYVIPSYRRRGIGKVLYHLMTEESVRKGAQYGFGFTGLHNPFRLILHSVGYQYWFLGFGWMSVDLQ